MKSIKHDPNAEANSGVVCFAIGIGGIPPCRHTPRRWQRACSTGDPALETAAADGRTQRDHRKEVKGPMSPRSDSEHTEMC